MRRRYLNHNRIPSSQITPEREYLDRRRFLVRGGALAAAALVSACAPATPELSPTAAAASALPRDEQGNPAASLEQVTTFNNYYEFTTSKTGVAKLAARLAVDPWTVQVDGLVHTPLTLGMEDLRRQFPPEERIYRLRCVEAWSMVIPWEGFPLARLLALAEPQAGARYVAFETLYRPAEMPGQADRSYPWPYREGLRLDEAMHELTILATGLYGQPLAPQSGAPLRLVVPWKYGFKSIKSIVRITLTDVLPATFWNAISPEEYGFYANVNPGHPHPRWSQANEARMGSGETIATQPFNGYESRVKELYTGMDLDRYF